MERYIGGILPLLIALALDRGGPPAYFVLWSVLMLVVLVALSCVKRHVPGTAAAAARP